MGVNILSGLPAQEIRVSHVLLSIEISLLKKSPNDPKLLGSANLISNLR